MQLAVDELNSFGLHSLPLHQHWHRFALLTVSRRCQLISSLSLGFIKKFNDFISTKKVSIVVNTWINSLILLKPLLSSSVLFRRLPTFLYHLNRLHLLLIFTSWYSSALLSSFLPFYSTLSSIKFLVLVIFQYSSCVFSFFFTQLGRFGVKNFRLDKAASFFLLLRLYVFGARASNSIFSQRPELFSKQFSLFLVKLTHKQPLSPTQWVRGDGKS